MAEKTYEIPTIFIREFTKELILNSYPEEIELKVIEYKEYPEIKPQPEFKEELPQAPIPIKHIEAPWNPSEIQPPQKPIVRALTRQMPQMQPQPIIKKRVILKTRPRIITPIQFQRNFPIMPNSNIPQKNPIQEQKLKVHVKEIDNPETPQVLSESVLAEEKLPAGFNLGIKLDKLVADPKITEIECRGPNQYILVKSMNKLSVTRSRLSQEEIQAVLQKFSSESKIPIVGGLFKAAVGDLVITAVISDIVGQKFIITKITPFTDYWK